MVADLTANMKVSLGQVSAKIVDNSLSTSLSQA